MPDKTPLTAAEKLRLQQLLQIFRSNYHFDILYRIDGKEDQQLITFTPGSADYEFLNSQLEILAGNYISRNLANSGDVKG